MVLHVMRTQRMIEVIHYSDDVMRLVQHKRNGLKRLLDMWFFE